MAEEFGRQNPVVDGAGDEGADADALPSARVLVVDDEQSIRHFVSRALSDSGHEVTTAATGAEAMRQFHADHPDLVVLDVRLPDALGLDLLTEMKKESADTEVIVITAVDEVETAVRAMKQGAFYFLRKPLALDELEGLVREGLEKRQLRRERDLLRNRMWKEEGHIRCHSPKMVQVYKMVEQVALGETTSVLIEGESGTGKELIARYIHKLSPRETKPFLDINCAAIPRDLLESELFGHEKGAFTDARAQKQGLLELANRGTLFLDEVGEMSLTLQVKLLRVLERMTFKRVGGVKDITVSVRIISATNQNLERRVKEGAVREDLFYRLKVVPILVPPLRERREDILPLALHFRDRTRAHALALALRQPRGSIAGGRVRPGPHRPYLRNLQCPRYPAGWDPHRGAARGAREGLDSQGRRGF
jgi:DNA-binding NtrC family response regulator